jgi:hypothetical protein
MVEPRRPAMPPFSPGPIPEDLKRASRWAPWKAVWLEKKGKYDKRPQHPTGGYGISTNNPQQWGSFEAAFAAARGRPDQFAGIGYLVTGPHGVVGVDLDHCVVNGSISEWAYEIVRTLNSYTEYSPSGTGLRIIVKGEIPADWTNHEVGIEVYAGHTARFLTITGNRVKAFPSEISTAPAGVLDALTQQYAKGPALDNVVKMPEPMPDILDELALPDIADLGLAWQTKNFLSDGTNRGDRSRELHAAAVDLYRAGLASDVVFSILATNPHAMEVALDHRRQDSDRALSYLWVEHAYKAKGKATNRVASADDFDVVSPVEPATGVPGKKIKFGFTPGEHYFDPNQPAVRWLIKNIMPEQGLGTIFGPSKSGKTFFCLDLAMCVGLGREWRGKKVAQAQVAYICAEGARGFCLRGRAYLEYHGIERQGLPIHVLADAPNLMETQDVKDLIAAVRSIEGVKLVIVDTLSQVTPGADENAGKDMGRAIAHCNTIARATGAFVLLVGHTGKDETKGQRGWSGMPAAYDLSIQVDRENDARNATIDKLKDAEGEGDEYPFHLHSVVLGQDEDGDDITSAVALPGPMPGAARRGPKALRGEIAKAIMSTAETMLGLGPVLTKGELINATAAKLDADEGAVHPRRKVRVRTQLTRLCETKHLLIDNKGVVTLPGNAL